MIIKLITRVDVIALLFLSFVFTSCYPVSPAVLPTPFSVNDAPLFDPYENARSTARADMAEMDQDDQILVWESQETKGSSLYSSCPEGCTYPPFDCYIKGNISFDTGEKIYHVPGQEYYEQTSIDISLGERWFCTEQEAVNNGWRKSSR